MQQQGRVDEVIATAKFMNVERWKLLEQSSGSFMKVYFRITRQNITSTVIRKQMNDERMKERERIGGREIRRGA